MTASGLTRHARPSVYLQGVAARGRFLPVIEVMADLALAVVILLVLAPPMRTSAPVAAGAMPVQTPAWVTISAWALAATVAVPVLLRRRRPLPALGIIVAASSAEVLLLDLAWPRILATVAATALALYTVRSLAAFSLTLVITAATLALGALKPDSATPTPITDAPTQIGFCLLALAAAWAVGGAVRQQRERAATATAQAARQVLADERRRIARELHDIVAHGMSLIAVKAGVANHVAEARPEEARDALRVIEATSRSALADLRSLLEVLRTEAENQPDLSPAPGLGGLAALADRAASAGVRVDMEISLPQVALPQGVQLSAYRIVQEALTNVVKHAGPVACRVAVTATAGEVRIEVTDDGQPAHHRESEGVGLLGMRERVATYGGEFTAGPRPTGGFAVHATLPYRPATAA